MVERDDEPIIESEQSQTVFEGQQTLLQAPPVANKKMSGKKKIIVIGGIFFLITMALLIVWGSRTNTPVVRVSRSEPSPTPTPIYIDPAKENELKRVETIVQSANPENLIVPPPEVDMTVTF